MQRLFSTFPGNWPGVGLLLLRVAAGLTLLVQAAKYLPEWRSLQFDALAAVVMSLLAGVSLLAGILTPVTSGLLVLGAVVFGFAPTPPPAASLLKIRLAMIDVIAIATAIGLLGPGAYSLDAYLFGRREIYIPRSQHPPKS